MRKWLSNPFAFVIVVALAVAAWSLWHVPSEPMYKGKRLSFWLREYTPVFITVGKERGKGADEALRSIATNAIPTLLKMLQAKDSALTLKLVLLAQKQKLIKFNYENAMDRNYEAMYAFEILGASASNAVPELIKIYDENVSTQSQCATVVAIGDIGPAATNAIPVLLRGVKTADDFVVRGSAAWALGEIHGQPELVVPELVKLLHDPVSDVSWAASEALGQFGTNAESAVPILLKMLGDQNSRYRQLATNALIRIDPQAAAQAGIKGESGRF